MNTYIHCTIDSMATQIIDIWCTLVKHDRSAAAGVGRVSTVCAADMRYVVTTQKSSSSFDQLCCLLVEEEEEGEQFEGETKGPHTQKKTSKEHGRDRDKHLTCYYGLATGELLD